MRRQHVFGRIHMLPELAPPTGIVTIVFGNAYR